MKKLLIAALCALAGCSTYSLEELRHTEHKGNAFQSALAQHYMAFSEQAEKGYDWQNSWHFADKGLLAAYGQEIGPEELSDWDIPADAKVDLEVAREKLLEVLTPENIEKHAELAASAQFHFDCWVKNQDQNWQFDLIAECRDGFENDIAQLQGAKKSLNGAAVEKFSYIVYFQWGQAGLGLEAQNTVDSAALELTSKNEPYEVVLNGHTDASGLQAYNMKLSQRRAEAVKKRLVERGVNAKAITIFAYGESEPAYKTADGIKEKTNRRVEIFLHD